MKANTAVKSLEKYTRMHAKASNSLLLVEDHTDIAEMVTVYLESRGFSVDYAGDGVTGLHLAVSNDYDVVVLDLMLPGMDGLKVCEKLRQEAQKDTPIIMLTARDTLDDKITGLDSGADDYLIKPFAIRELEARIRSLIRRHKGDASRQLLQVGNLSLDTATLKVMRSTTELSLTPIGLKILTVLMRASPAVVSRREIERQVWGDILPDSDTLRSHLYYLRKVIDKPFDNQLLHTIQGRGYKIVVDDAED